jgi:hypothetical protein
MGDRANVYVKQGKEERPGGGQGVFLYTHWGGYCLPDKLAHSLSRAPDRLTDGQYLARIIFSDMIKGSGAETTGYGISAQIGDGEYPLLEVDTTLPQPVVNVYKDTDGKAGIAKTFTIPEYLALFAKGASVGQAWPKLKEAR